MNRYRAYAPLDDEPITDGDTFLLGVDQFDAKDNLQPGMVQEAVNIDFNRANADTRGGFVCLPQLATTSFGFDWTSRVNASDKTWQSVCYGNNIFVAVASNGVMTSEDGVTWASRTPSSNEPWQSVCWGLDKFVAVAFDASVNPVMTSANGVTWTNRSAPDRFWHSVAYGNGTFVAVGYSGVSTPRVMSSSDGVTWTEQTASLADGPLWGVCYGNGLFVAVAANSSTTDSVMTSPDGVTWTSRTAATASTWENVAYGNGLYVAVGSNSGPIGRAMYSSDGVTWSSGTPAANNSWFGITFGAGMFVAVSINGTGNRVMRSYDGNTWLGGTSAADNEWESVTFGESVFVAVSETGSGNQVMTTGASSQIFASGIYSDPNSAGEQWFVLCGPTSAGFFGSGKSSKTVSYPAGYVIDEQSKLVQANNYLIINSGTSRTPIRWAGSFAASFEAMPDTDAGAGFESIPHSNHSVYYVNRLWVKSGKDKVAASDLLDFTTYDDVYNDFNLNIGSSDFVVCTYPFGVESLLVFKNRSIQLLRNVAGALDDVVATEVTRQVGIIGINAVTAVGPDVVYMSDRNINLISLTDTSNAVQHKTMPLSRNIKRIMARVNWNYAYKVSMAYWDNKLFVALPLDGNTACNAIVVYNFVTEQWWGEWEFDASLGMRIQGFLVGNYGESVRLFAVTDDGRIFVTDEGFQDRSGATVAEIASSLTTRAYRMNNENRVNRRMWADLASWRPEFTITAYVDGANEYDTLITDQTFSRANSWIFHDSAYSLTNSGDNYNRAGRKDYAGYCSDSAQPQSGFLPEMLQEYRLPLITRRKGRTVWYNITNAQGRLQINGVGGESRPGDRGNLIQVI